MHLYTFETTDKQTDTQMNGRWWTCCGHSGAMVLAFTLRESERGCTNNSWTHPKHGYFSWFNCCHSALQRLDNFSPSSAAQCLANHPDTNSNDDDLQDFADLPHRGGDLLTGTERSVTEKPESSCRDMKQNIERIFQPKTVLKWIFSGY